MSSCKLSVPKCLSDHYWVVRWLMTRCGKKARLMSLVGVIADTKFFWNKWSKSYFLNTAKTSFFIENISKLYRKHRSQNPAANWYFELISISVCIYFLAYVYKRQHYFTFTTGSMSTHCPVSLQKHLTVRKVLNNHTERWLKEYIFTSYKQEEPMKMSINSTMVCQ